MIKITTTDNIVIHHTTKIFSGGEVQVNLLIDPFSVTLLNGREGEFVIEANLRSSNDIMELFMVTSALRSSVIGAEITLVMPYVPYARQDRVMNPGEALSVKVMANLINSQEYREVLICDPHSDVTPALINNCTVLEQSKYLREPILTGPKNFVLVAPDSGALKKVNKAALEYKGLIAGVVRADKTRDVLTGEITDTVVYSGHIGDKSFLIVDDICDGGRTFIELAAKLKPLTNGKIHLFVTHGIFSYGFDKLRENIDHIWVGHSFVDLDPVADFVKIVKPRPS